MKKDMNWFSICRSVVAIVSLTMGLSLLSGCSSSDPEVEQPGEIHPTVPAANAPQMESDAGRAVSPGTAPGAGGSPVPAPGAPPVAAQQETAPVAVPRQKHR